MPYMTSRQRKRIDEAKYINVRQQGRIYGKGPISGQKIREDVLKRVDKWIKEEEKWFKKKRKLEKKKLTQQFGKYKVPESMPSLAHQLGTDIGAKQKETTKQVSQLRKMGLWKNIFQQMGIGGGAIGAGVSAGIQAKKGGMGRAGAAGVGIITALSSLVGTFKDLATKMSGLNKLNEIVNSLINLVMGPGFQIFADLMNSLGSILDAILTPLKPFFTFLEIIGDYLTAVLAPILPEIWDNLVPLIEELFGGLEEGQGIVELFNIDFGELANAFVKFTEGLPIIIEDILELAQLFWGNADQVFEDILTFIENAVSIAKTVAENIDKFVAFAAAISTIVTALTEPILELWVTLAETFANNIEPIMTIIESLGLLITYILTPAFKQVLKWLLDTVRGIVNIGKGWNDFWGSFGNLGGWSPNPLSYRDWYTEDSGGGQGPPKIEQFRQFGGVVTQPELAVLGEAGTEFVFTKGQLRELEKMGFGSGNEEMIGLMEENTKYSKALYKLFKNRLKWSL